MATNTAFRIAELDYDQIKANLKTFLRGQTEIQDYDFEGSGMNILLDLLTYNTHYAGFYMNMLGAESFIDTAQTRGAAVSHAQQLGYVPRSKTASTAIVNIKITPSDLEDNDVQTLALPRWTSFQSQAVDGINYNFVTVNSNVATKQDGSFSFSNVHISQGEPITRTFEVNLTNNPKNKYVIPSSNIDISTLYVTVQESTTNTYSEIYTRHDDLMALRSNTKVYFVEEEPSGNGVFALSFGDGYIGKQPQNGNIITATYLDTAGKYANKSNSFILIEDINGFNDNVIISSVSAAASGAEQETTEEIKYRAPRYYTTQNRAVTKNDFEELLLEEYPNIESISIWGGEENIPPIYGKVFISLKPKTNFVITSLEKERIIKNILEKYSTLTVIPEIVNPGYTYLLVRSKVYYDSNLTNYDKDEIASLVRTAILNYRDNQLKKFNSKFRVSILQSQLDAADPSITGNSLEYYVQKRITPTLGASENYEIDFKIPLRRGTSATKKLFIAPEIKVYDNFNTLRSCFIEEVPDSYTGIDSIDIISTGQEYTEAPTVTITGDGTGATAQAHIINGKLERIDVTNRGSNYTKATVSITTNNNGFGATARAILEAKNGELRLGYYKTNGEKVIINNKIGTINYETGLINLINLKVEDINDNDNYNQGIFTINIIPEEDDISPVRNNIIDIDENDSSSIRITVMPDA